MPQYHHVLNNKNMQNPIFWTLLNLEVISNQSDKNKIKLIEK